jgi:hypothetical protein
MQLKMKIILGIALSLFAFIANAQYTQQLRGTVVDLVLQKPLAGATVSIRELGKTVVTDERGNFRFRDLPVGTYQLTISYAGFKEAALDNIIINAGKETVLTAPLESLVHVENEVVLKANSKKNKPLNDMSAVSARAFTVEETQKYAAAVNDPLRMAASFPGIRAADDGNNTIVIRGNSPTGLLWRMEGIDIPNPNHFSNAGGSGGGISILSSQLLSNSDFVTGAFAAEYGNALSGVFDLKLRKGNNERKEYTLQAGLLGLNVAAEGPFSPFYKGSYLINYRYSTLELMNKLGIPVGGEGSTNFQDLSYNIYLPAGKSGDFTLFGFGGLSSEKANAERDSLKWDENDDRYPSDFISNTGMNGLTHSISLGKNTTLKSAIGLSITKNGFEEQYIEDDYSLTDSYKDSYKTRKWTLTSTMNHRFNNRHNMRAGLIANLVHFNYYQFSRDGQGEPLKERINTRGNTQTWQGFAQWQYRLSNYFTINSGLHYLLLDYNRSSSIEPRASVKWDMSRRSSIAFGYGLHSQLQGMGVYFAKQQDPGGTNYPNKELGFTRSHHFVLSHNYLLANNLRLKTELYYQHLFDVPVSTSDTSSFSTLNIIDDYITTPLVNRGKGRNYGVEVSLEKYLSRNYYFMLSSSIYQSKYKAADGIERNTRFNGNYIINFTGGKEFVNGSGTRTFGVNIKTIYAGGYRDIPVDIERSRQARRIIYDEKNAYSIQNPAYFRTDVRLSVKWNRRRLTSTLSLDIQNVTNRLNVLNQWVDIDRERVAYNYQTGFIPVLNYKIEF